MEDPLDIHIVIMNVKIILLEILLMQPLHMFLLSMKSKTRLSFWKSFENILKTYLILLKKALQTQHLFKTLYLIALTQNA